MVLMFVIIYFIGIHMNEKLPIENFKFSEEDFDACSWYYKSYLVQILNGEYDLKDARENLYGLIGSEYDNRVKL